MSFAFNDDKGKKELGHKKLIDLEVVGEEGIGDPKMSYSITGSDVWVAGVTSEMVQICFPLDRSSFAGKDGIFFTLFEEYQPISRQVIPIIDWDKKANIVGLGIVQDNGNITFHFPTIPTCQMVAFVGNWVRKNES